ncbi:MAG: YggS family pyridoxal phosphate-dependent enzyme [Methanomethylovorans sp.]|nr:YggS family pyridoxal phosphate-dependent enzyme [Methanomethylovorans sp.]
MTVDENIKFILKELGKIKLVCVTKRVDAQRINEAIKAGASIIGESKIQEYEEKCHELLPCEKHFIGHLQSNKVKKAVQLFDVIQSVDSLRLIQNINKKAKAIDKVQNVYFQVNIGKEPQKFGILEEDLIQVITHIKELNNINVQGLMCIPPVESPEETRFHFKKMKALFDIAQQQNMENVNIQELSMGMSSDYRIAIEEGATMVRIGSLIFGERKSQK